jgi:hypothetical protein
VGKDVFDGAVCLRLADSRCMDEVLWFLEECWKDLGIPEQVQLDNAPELAGWGPRFNGSMENFNGWFQPPLLDRRYRRPGDLRRELARLQEAVNTQHAHPRVGGKTPAQHRRGLRLQKLPTSFEVPTDRQPIVAGRVTFLRRVSAGGTVTVLSQMFRVGKGRRGLYLRLVVDTGRGWLTAYLNGHVLKRWPFKLLNE